MSYYTWFNGKLEIELKEPYLQELQAYLSNEFSANVRIVVTEDSLKVADEWKDSGLMEKVVLFIAEHGKLISGSIRCNGEDSKDVWEIFVEGNQPFIRELGKTMTLNRSERKEKMASTMEQSVYLLKVGA